MRLNRFLASAGFGSRRSVESLITDGSVRINGQVVTSLSTTIAPTDVVKVGNRTVESQQHLHAIINKPKGFICSSADEAGRRTVLDLVPDDWPRVYNVGRLDRESEGLLVITNDGDLSLALTHPRYKVEKEYEVLLDRPFEPAHREKLLRGFHIEGGRAKMERISVEGPNRLRVVLLQGIKRQIRLMLYDCGYEVESLRRVRIGTIWLDRLRPGEWRLLNPKEVSALKEGKNPDPDAAPRSKVVSPTPNPRRRTEGVTPIHKLPFQDRPSGPRIARPSRRKDAETPRSGPPNPEEKAFRGPSEARPRERTRFSDRPRPDRRETRPFATRPSDQGRPNRADARAAQARTPRDLPREGSRQRTTLGDHPKRGSSRDGSSRPSPFDNRSGGQEGRASRPDNRRSEHRDKIKPGQERQPAFTASDRPRRAASNAPRTRSDDKRSQRFPERPTQGHRDQKPSDNPKRKAWDAWD